MDYYWQWIGLGMGLLALIVAVITYVRLNRLVRRTELQLRSLAQRESWQRRAQGDPVGHE